MEWTTLFFVNWFLNIFAMEFFAIRGYKPILDGNEERDAKFPSFRRTDIQWLNRPWIYMTCHFMLARMIFAFSVLFICSVVCSICVIGINYDEPITGIRYKINRTICWISSLSTDSMAGGLFYIHRVKPEVCYKKYLGPDWKADYDTTNCGSVISNHSSLMDIAIHSFD